MKNDSLEKTTASRPLKILVLGAGQTSHLRERVRCFVERGHEVYLLSEYPSGVPGVHEIPQKFLGLRKPRTVSCLNSYLRAIRRIKPEIVHVHYAGSLEGWVAAAIDRHPLIVSVMGGDILFEEQGSPTAHTRFLTLALLRSADWITAKSNHLIAVLNDLDGLGTKATRIVWGVNLKRFFRSDASKLRKELGLAPNDQVLLSPRALQPLYNIHLIVESLREILRTQPRVKLLIAEHFAEPPYKARIEAAVARLRLREQVIFLGDVPHDDMAKYYSLADVVISVPSSDGLPQSLFEAMACEVPAVISNLDRYKEIVSHKESAYFVDTEPRAISQGVCQLLSDAALQRRIAENALQIVKSEANLEKDVARVEQKYFELLKSPPQNGGLLKRPGILMRLFLHLLATHGLFPSRTSR